MPRPCLICSSSAKSAKAAELIARGMSDQAVADALNALTPGGIPMSAMAASRHRRLLVVAPARAVAEMGDRGQAVAAQREQALAAATSGDPLASLQLTAIVADIARIAARLDLSADEAAAGGQHTAHAALAGQLLRQTEIRARIGGHDKPTPSVSHATPFSVTINFSGGRTETISTSASPGDTARTIEGEIEDTKRDESDMALAVSPERRLARAFGSGKVRP